MVSATRDGDRLYRYGGDEFAAILPGADRVGRARGRRTDPPGRPARRRIHGRPEPGIPPGRDGQRGRRLLPRRRPDQGRARRGRRSRPLPGQAVGPPPRRRRPPPIPYLQALDETALALLDHHDPDACSRRSSAARLRCSARRTGTSTSATPTTTTLVMPRRDRRLPGLPRSPDRRRAKGWPAGSPRPDEPLAIDDYDALGGSVDAPSPTGLFGSVVGVPLTSGGSVVGVLGLASGHGARRWDQRDIDALTSFGKLASIALDNARLIDVAKRGALYDPTTGLPNRELLTDRISHALAGHRADDTESIAVVLLGLDRFKVINESLGHAIGDRLLVAVGQRLVHGLRPGDTVARVGGDEFGIIFDPVAGRGRGAPHRRPDRRRADAPRSRSPVATGSSAPRWASPWPQPGRATPDELLREAEIAMVRAKADATQRHALFEPSMSAQTLERVRARERPAAGARTRRAARALPADRHPREQRDRRVRGAGALAAPDARPRPAPRVHPPRRGDRADRPGRQVGPRDRLPPGRQVAREPDRPDATAARSSRSTCRPGSSCRPTSSRTSPPSSPRPASKPARSSSRSPRAC